METFEEDRCCRQAQLVADDAVKVAIIIVTDQSLVSLTVLSS
jgi:hypothetical protein